MTFQPYWESMLERGFADTPANRSLAKATWDTAICSAQAACLDHGKPRAREAIMDSLSELHTWANTSPESIGPVS